MVSTNSSEMSAMMLRRGRGRSDNLARCLLTFGLAIFAHTFGSTSAHAQGKVITISEVTIVGRVQKPIAAVDVSRIQPKMTLGELRQPFLDRIEEAIYHAPF